jgi:hypothetical protein
MRKLTLLLAALALAAMPSVADAAKKGKKRIAAAPPAATKQDMPGESGARVVGGFFREVGKIGQPPAPAKKSKKS